MGEFSIFHWLVVLAIVLIFFGGRRIPEVMKGLGEGIRNFKDGMSGRLRRHPRRRHRLRRNLWKRRSKKFRDELFGKASRNRGLFVFVEAKTESLHSEPQRAWLRGMTAGETAMTRADRVATKQEKHKTEPESDRSAGFRARGVVSKE